MVIIHSMIQLIKISCNSECSAVLALLQVIGVFNNNIILHYVYVSAVLVDGNFRRHIDLKLSCYVVYLQTAGLKCSY